MNSRRLALSYLPVGHYKPRNPAVPRVPRRSQVFWLSADGVVMPKLPSSHTDHELASFAAVSALLWTERELLEQVLYRLTVQRLVLTSGATRWLSRVNDEVNAAVSQISGSEVLRAAEIEALAESLHLPHETTLAELIAVAPEPWSTLLAEHRTALRALVGEIEDMGGDVKRLLQAGMSAIRETLESLARTVGTTGAGYDSTGSSVSLATGPMLLDEQA